MQRGALRADGFENRQDGVNVTIGQPGARPYTHTLAEQFDDLNRLVVFEPKTIKRLGFAKSLAALCAAESLNNAVYVLEVAEPFGWAGTAIALQTVAVRANQDRLCS